MSGPVPARRPNADAAGDRNESESLRGAEHGGRRVTHGEGL